MHAHSIAFSHCAQQHNLQILNIYIRGTYCVSSVCVYIYTFMDIFVNIYIYTCIYIHMSAFWF